MEQVMEKGIDVSKSQTSAVNEVSTNSVKRSRLDSFAREENGKLSSSRLLMMLWGGGVFVTWALASLRGEALQPIPESVITLIGLLVSAKTVQRFGE